jgi:hypothetical protein
MDLKSRLVASELLMRRLENYSLLMPRLALSYYVFTIDATP